MGHTRPRPLLPRGPGSPLRRTPRHPVAGATGRYGSLPASPTPPPGPQGLRDGSPHGARYSTPPQAPTPGARRPRAGSRTCAPPGQRRRWEHTREGRGTPSTPEVTPRWPLATVAPEAVAALTPRGPGGLIDPRAWGAGSRASPIPRLPPRVGGFTDSTLSPPGLHPVCPRSPPRVEGQAVKPGVKSVVARPARVRCPRVPGVSRWLLRGSTAVLPRTTARKPGIP